MSKHAFTALICISCYNYAYQLRCTKQVVLTTLKKIFLFPPPLQNQPSMAVCNSAGIYAVCGCTINRTQRTTKLLPKVVICIIVTWYTYWSCESMFWHLKPNTQKPDKHLAAHPVILCISILTVPFMGLLSEHSTPLRTLYRKLYIFDNSVRNRYQRSIAASITKYLCFNAADIILLSW